MSITQTIQTLIQQHPIVLFMKGDHATPLCGFSFQVVHILDNEGATFHCVNVLEDEAIRQGIKDFSDWPTIPQLYVHGEFIGGCDIVSELHASGELKALLATATSETA